MDGLMDAIRRAAGEGGEPQLTRRYPVLSTEEAEAMVERQLGYAQENVTQSGLTIMTVPFKGKDWLGFFEVCLEDGTANALVFLRTPHDKWRLMTGAMTLLPGHPQEFEDAVRAAIGLF